jgi:hypothetical protein
MHSQNYKLTPLRRKMLLWLRSKLNCTKNPGLRSCGRSYFVHLPSAVRVRPTRRWLRQCLLQVSFETKLTCSCSSGLTNCDRRVLSSSTAAADGQHTYTVQALIWRAAPISVVDSPLHSGSDCRKKSKTKIGLVG